jgi:hypothetical protein
MIGDAQWLIDTEQKYGGFVCGIPRKIFSPKEKYKAEFAVFMCGGDRMSPDRHGYAETYARNLRPLVARRNDPVVILEIGILRGTGLALWSDLFPNATIIGLDLDTEIFESHVENLKSLGAFKNHDPEIYAYDKLLGAREQTLALLPILDNRKLDLVIDDGCHRERDILVTFDAVLPFCKNTTVYFAEDNWTVASHFFERVPDREVVSAGAVTVIRPRCECW